MTIHIYREPTGEWFQVWYDTNSRNWFGQKCFPVSRYNDSWLDFIKAEQLTTEDQRFISKLQDKPIGYLKKCAKAGELTTAIFPLLDNGTGAEIEARREHILDSFGIGPSDYIGKLNNSKTITA
jgi:hypothetical protein